MYSGKMIEQLMEMVARAEDHAHQGHVSELERSEPGFASRFMYEMSDPQPMMIGVA
jgi:hypothetical protein